ncbi:d054021e-4a61-4c9b-ab70-d4af5802dca5 [Thermothielavioides terrestris]|nr:d054021e-4a61-4c9b-ab70-d4af5802dca5 [Thermothielavioides terrestris]
MTIKNTNCVFRRGFGDISETRRDAAEPSRQAARVTSFLENGVGSDIAKLKEQMQHRWDWIWYIDL